MKKRLHETGIIPLQSSSCLRGGGKYNINRFVANSWGGFFIPRIDADLEAD